MKILQVLHKGAFNTGSVHQMYTLAKELAARGHAVCIAGRPGTEVETVCGTDGIPFYAFPFRSDWDSRTIHGLSRLLRERDIEVAHVHKGRPHTLTLFTSMIHPIPCFVANRGVSFPLTIFNRSKYRSKRCHAVVCVCDAIRRVVIRTGRVPEEKVHVIYAGTDLARFDPAIVDGRSVRREFSFVDDDIVIGQTGLREWRGWRTLLDAFARLAPEEPRTRLLLVAAKDAAHRAEILAEATRLGVEGRVTVTGYRADMPEISAAQDIVCDFSYAGLGITGTLREGMAMGRPVVCSAAGGNPELVVDGRTGFLVPARDPAAAADRLRELVRDGDLRRRMGSAGRKRVEDGFSLKRRIDEIERLYRDILNRNRKSMEAGGGPGPRA